MQRIDSQAGIPLLHSFPQQQMDMQLQLQMQDPLGALTESPNTAKGPKFIEEGRPLNAGSPGKTRCFFFI